MINKLMSPTPLVLQNVVPTARTGIGSFLEAGMWEDVGGGGGRGEVAACPRERIDVKEGKDFVGLKEL